MADEITFELKGQEELVRIIDRLIKGLHPDKVEPELKKGADIIAREVRRNTPKGPTGNLRKAVKVKKLQRWGGPAPYICAIDRKKAPHAWLVTHGTSGVRPVNPPRRVVIDGQPALITNTGVMPPNRYFADAVEAKETEVLFRLDMAFGKMIEDAMR